MHQRNQSRLGTGLDEDVLQLNDPELHTDHLRLYREVMQTAGEAAQTLAAVMRLATRTGNRLQTFASLERMCAISLVPRRTAQLHLQKLCAAQWLKHCGRELLPLSTYRRRRTVTYWVDEKRLAASPRFAMLPRAFADPRDPIFQSWANRAVIATMISQDMLPEQVEMQSYGCLDGRELMRTTTIAKVTGLSQKTVLRAVNHLAWHKLLLIYEEDSLYQTTLLVGLNRELLVKRSVIPHRVAGKERPALLRRRPREPRTQNSSAESSESQTFTRRGPDGQSCAGSEEDPAPTPGQTCAEAGTKLRRGRDKVALLISKNLLVRTSGKNPLEETLGQNVPRRHATDQILVDVSKDVYLADELFDRMEYSGTDGALVWKACAWHRLSLGPTQADLVSAANGVKECRAHKPVAYFRQILIELLGLPRFNELVRRTARLPPGDWGRSTPRPAWPLSRSRNPEHIASILAQMHPQQAVTNQSEPKTALEVRKAV